MALSVFDLDSTLVRNNSSYQFCHYLVQQKILPRTALLYSGWSYFRHHALSLSLFDLHLSIFERYLSGLSLPMLEMHVERFLAKYLGDNLYIPAIDRLKLSQHLGHHTLLLSNSPSFLVEAIAKQLDFHEWRATEYAVDNDGKLCHIASLMRGEEKASVAMQVANRLKLEKEKITAYSDSILDLPLLLTVGQPIAVNPDRKLARYSKEHQWQII